MTKVGRQIGTEYLYTVERVGAAWGSQSLVLSVGALAGKDKGKHNLNSLRYVA